MPRVSIVIPTYNHCDDLLKPCLESIKKFTDLTQAEVIVVANGCTDNTKEYVTSLGEPFKLLWFDKGLGYTRATNEGIKASTGDYIVFLNNDTVLIEQPRNYWIDTLIAPFQSNPIIGVTGPMRTFNLDANKEFIIFFCACTSREVINRIGILDEVFSPGYGEDIDFCARVENAGMAIMQTPYSNNYTDETHRFMAGNFPIFHKGNVTFQNWPGGEDLLRKNNAIIRARYHDGLDITRAYNADGFMNVDELKWLATEARKRKTIIEVGSWHGRSSRAIADNLQPGGVLYCVDTWDGSETEKETNHASARMKEGDHAFYEFLQNNIDHVSAGRIVPLRMSSQNAAKFFKEQSIKADMIFIDADHTYEGVCKDIESWQGVLADDDAIFCGHDINAWAGVNQAVSEKMKRFFIGNKTTIWYTNKPNIWPVKGKVYDCFPFYNELDLLEARFEELWDVVDRFVICEATLTHGGKPKPLYFRDNLQRFEKYLSKVTHVVLDDYPELEKIGMEPWDTERSWYVERRQRDRLMQGLQDCKDEDIILISDCDEIPKAEAIRNYRPESGINAVEMDLYYYRLDLKATDPWYWTRILPWPIMKNMTPCQVRYVDNYDKQSQIIHNGGWHFSYLGDLDFIIEKISSTAHQEYNTDLYKNRERLKKLVAEGKDIYDRPLQYEFVAITSDSHPKYIYENLGGKYAKYIESKE